MLRAERNLANPTLNHLVEFHIPGPQKSHLSRKMMASPNLQNSLFTEKIQKGQHIFVFLWTITG